MLKKILWLTIVAFITANIVLVLVDKSGKVERQAYISDWEAVYKADLSETIYAKGVVSYSGQEYMYFDKSSGQFDGFLVEAGSEVSEGDPLFTYHVADYYATEASLENQLTQLSAEVSALEDAVAEIVAYDIPSPAAPVVSSDDEDSIEVVVSSGESVGAEMQMKQYLIEKEQALAIKQEQERLIETQLADLQAGGDTITVTSPYQGKVKSISTTLADPLIVIENTRLQVNGELTEEDRVKVEPGDSVYVTLVEQEKVLQGSVKTVGETPVEEARVDSDSVYPLVVDFEEEANTENVLPGYHSNLSITINEVLDANTVHDQFVFLNEAWKLTNAGKLEAVTVETGLHIGKQLEVINGLTVGDVVTPEFNRESYSGMPFITPLKLVDVPWLEIGKYSDWKKYMVMGLLAR
ncbi:efflux RND transporter periplasmic adaptor subunit [Ornithinibacillus contaminans]|uniref:efflux RND transporter periplasmic adaptor subunit n=1 Tax=Ornithinibacillus contaminans TaxID=694055 RepID=UPI00064DF0C3|nr:efflux RND transporter periplasmic adaptor subunit [Ornithinibacillus contaminans]